MNTHNGLKNRVEAGAERIKEDDLKQKSSTELGMMISVLQIFLVYLQISKNKPELSLSLSHKDT